MAIRGEAPLHIQHRAGHTSFEMTQKYIRTAEAVGEAIGDVFPALPECLLAGANRPANRPDELQLSETIVEASGIEPDRSRVAGARCNRQTLSPIAIWRLRAGPAWLLFRRAALCVAYGRARRAARPYPRGPQTQTECDADCSALCRGMAR